MPSPMFLQRFTENSASNPERIALIWQGRKLSYGELHQMAVAAKDDLPPDPRPRHQLICVPAIKAPETIALLIAAHAQGLATLVPSADLGHDALLELATRTGCTHLLRAGTPTRRAEVTAVAGRREDTEDTDDTEAAELEAAAEPGPWSAASLVLTTSGSTGVPKTVPISHRAVDRFTDWAAATFAIRPGTRVLGYAPLNFDLSLLDVWTTLAVGGTVVLVDPAKATDGAHLAGLVAEADVVQSVPMVYRLITAATDVVFPSAERQVILTGDTTDPALAARVSALFPGAQLHNIYGCTETNDSFHHRIGPADVAAGSPLPIGRPLPGVRALILGPDGAVLEGPGSGELVVSTPFQTSGYLDPADDAGRFLTMAGTRYYRTGDIVRRDRDGALFLEGRQDFQVKIRGVRTNLQDVERVLLDHPQVTEAAVVAVPDTLAGRQIHALVRRADGTGLNSLRLRQHCMTRLPRTAIPSRVVVTELPLPSTSTGKPDRKSISALLTEEAARAHS